MGEKVIWLSFDKFCLANLLWTNTWQRSHTNRAKKLLRSNFLHCGSFRRRLLLVLGKQVLNWSQIRRKLKMEKSCLRAHQEMLADCRHTTWLYLLWTPRIRISWHQMVDRQQQKACLESILCHQVVEIFVVVCVSVPPGNLPILRFQRNKRENSQTNFLPRKYSGLIYGPIVATIFFHSHETSCKIYSQNFPSDFWLYHCFTYL